ncbi:Uncharacterised protein [Mycobacteroides abscessus subsp. bolletii]|uniref:hypothetical protein n=1 Tax=Mycobacteroides abscessus TaxID=36809 RepID=UPI000927A254|nr:hypothetical protein [Mycobacteroides abscessus]SKS30345.1 Uncharacterised protein [Mycobacteroides abscessus subsp. abscessus]SHU53435.1 Uncharacterised protein [Mycobacteroides abscessus subsp. bolletii]SHW62211.1 Uncharacterised protein [Mycobacteroides abscessus subsp. bolletii]SHW90121.1 Uncharacterised protein [Mycobacteroides abscessus subsp. bolletii]SHX35487.1 Uncharacterised protein [Mycobacteroides abscessus subsp. bolletii]
MLTADRKLTLAGFVVGILSLASYPLLFAVTPVVPLIIGGVASISPKTRPFAYGALIAAGVAVVALIIFLVALSMTTPGTETYGPGYGV